MAPPGMTSHILFLLSLACVSRAATVVTYDIDEQKKAGEFVGNVAADSGILANLSSTEKQNLQFDFAVSANSYLRLFRIKQKTGIIETAKPLDREQLCGSQAKCLLPLKVSLRSQSGDFFKIIHVSVNVKDINDNSPSFKPRQSSVRIQESSKIGDRFQLPLATDQDIGDYSIVSYAIISGNILNTFELNFSKTGNSINELQLVLKRLVDREKSDRYTLNVLATDGGRPSKSDVLVVNIVIADVNDQPPRFVNLPYRVSLTEDFGKDETVLTVSATDSDTGNGGVIAYSFGPNSDFDVSSVFAIDSKSGAIKTKVNLDYETKQSYKFTVVARDSGLQPLSAQATVDVTITDVNDNPPLITLNTKNSDDVVEISETAGIRSFVVHISVFDADSNANGVVKCTIDSGLFILERVEDKDFIILLNTKLNREVRDAYPIKITCMDRGTVPKSGSKVITVKVGDVNDNRPRFRNRTHVLSIKENNVAGHVLLTVEADDLDIGANGRITYSISPEATQYLTINENNGEITAKRSFDRERKGESEIRLQVIATDGGKPPFSDSASVVITVLDENDVDPKFEKSMYAFNVTEHSASNIAIGQVKATDGDEGLNGLVTYSLVPSRQASKFSISPSDGMLKTLETFDREKQASYTFGVLAEDHGVPRRQSTSFLTIIVDDINDNRPVIRLPNNGTIRILDSFPLNGVLLKLNSYDVDAGQNAVISYGIKNSRFGEKFAIDRNSGEIRLAASLAEPASIGTHTLIITAKDNGLQPLRSERLLTVIVSVDKRTGKPDGSEQPGSNEQTNLIIIVVIVSVSTLISITLIGAIYIIHSRQKLDKVKNTNAQLASVKADDNATGSYSEQSYSSEASTTSTECETTTRQVVPAVDRLFPHCNSPNIVISGNVYQPKVKDVGKTLLHLKSPRTSSPVSLLVGADDRRTNHNTSAGGNASDVIGYGDTMDLRRSLRNPAQQRHISELTKKANPYTQYIGNVDSGSLLT